jgi:hypothetical protein
MLSQLNRQMKTRTVEQKGKEGDSLHWDTLIKANHD